MAGAWRDSCELAMCVGGCGSCGVVPALVVRRVRRSCPAPRGGGYPGRSVRGDRRGGSPRAGRSPDCLGSVGSGRDPATDFFAVLTFSFSGGHGILRPSPKVTRRGRFGPWHSAEGRCPGPVGRASRSLRWIGEREGEAKRAACRTDRLLEGGAAYVLPPRDLSPQ